MMVEQQRDGYDMKVKLLMIGDSGVGKTCMLLRYANDDFLTTYLATVGIDFKIKDVHLDGKRIKSQIWDTVGQWAFRSVTTTYFRGAHGIMLVYDVTDRASFDNIRLWVAEIQMHADVNVNMMVIGSKSDVHDHRRVTYAEGEQLAQEYNCPFCEVSSKYGTNIEQAFARITADVKNRLATEVSQQPLRKAGVLGHVVSPPNPCQIKVPQDGTDLRVELSISGAQSWFNKNKINGRYIPHHENYYEYTNIDSMGSKMVYAKSHWVVMKNKKVLATTKSTESAPPIVDSHRPAMDWYENFGVIFTRLYAQPTIKCTKLDLEKEPSRESIAVRGEIVIEKFFECCKEPERLGLSIPLFVSYSRVKMAIAEFDYGSSRQELNMEKMAQLQKERNTIEEHCKKLLSTVGKDSIKQEPLSECAATLESILPALKVLIEQVKGYFEEMCDLHNGNLEVARKCRDTLKELEDDTQRLSGAATVGSKLQQTQAEEGKLGEESRAAGEKADAVVAASTVTTEEAAPSPHTPSGAAGPAAAATTDAAVLEHLTTRVVHSAKKDWTCTIVRVGWIAVHESENRTDTEIDFRCLISSGITEAQSTKVNAALSAGMQHICASVGLDKSWSSSATSKCEREHHVKIAPHTKLTIEQEVVEGHITFAKTVFATKGKEKPFRVAKDSLRIHTCPAL